MKILRVIATLSPASGGPCQGIRNTIPALAGLGCENEVVCLDDPSSDYLGCDPFLIHALGPARNPWCYSKALMNWLQSNISRFDIVIVHGMWLFHGYAVWRVINSMQTKIKLPKIYLMPHGMLDPYFQRDPSRRLKAIRNWFYWKLIERKLVNEVDAILFTCEEELKLAREAFSPYHPKGEINVGYGVPQPPSYIPEMKIAFGEKCPQLGQQPYLLFLSRINPKKGVDLLIRAYAKLAKEHEANLDSSSADHSSLPTSHLFPHLVIAGPLDSSYAKEMQELAEELLPATLNHPKIHFPGMLQSNAKWGAFYGCEAFVLPSHQENFGIAVVEALACNKIVLISNKVNIWREISRCSAGYVASDTLDGTISLLTKYLNMDSYANKPLDCYNSNYGILSAAHNLINLLK